jgi:hypothetical protein
MTLVDLQVFLVLGEVAVFFIASKLAALIVVSSARQRLPTFTAKSLCIRDRNLVI